MRVLEKFEKQESNILFKTEHEGNKPKQEKKTMYSIGSKFS